MNARPFSLVPLFALLSILAACGRPPPPEPVQHVVVAGPSFVGRWIGVGQPNVPVEGEGRWDMVAVIAATDGECASIDYSTLGCSGIWNCQGYDGTTLTVHESIRVRNDRCVDGGQISMTFHETDADVIRWHYTSGTGLEVFADLHRQPQY